LGWLDRNDVPWSSASSSREIQIGGVSAVLQKRNWWLRFRFCNPALTCRRRQGQG
jgi:hypothetical protein